MTDPVATLLDLLNVEQLDRRLFRGRGDGGETLGRIYGGQVIAQALASAYRTVQDRPCHSLHAYFIRPGDPDRPVIYDVDLARDGGSFTTRRIAAIQNGQPILHMIASFHADDPQFDYQRALPDEAPDPETLEPRMTRRERLLPHIPEARRQDFMRPSPIELREADDRDPFAPTVAPDRHRVWFRLSRPAPMDVTTRQLVLAYASDMYLMTCATRPIGESFYTGRLIGASLDHSIWFHRPSDFSDWHLYEMDSPSVHGSRGMTRGLIYAQDGTLVASTAQEGLIRRRRPKPAARHGE